MPFNWRAAFVTSLHTIGETTFHLLVANHAIVHENARYALAHIPTPSLRPMASPGTRQGSPKRTIREADPDSDRDDETHRSAKRHSPSPSPSTSPQRPSRLPSHEPLWKRHVTRPALPSQSPAASPSRSASLEKPDVAANSQPRRHTRSSSRCASLPAPTCDTSQQDLMDVMRTAMHLADRMESNNIRYSSPSPPAPGATPDQTPPSSGRAAERALRRLEVQEQARKAALAKVAKAAKKKRMAEQRRKLEREASEKSFIQSKAEYEADLAATLQKAELRDSVSPPRQQVTTTRKRLLKPIPEPWLEKVKAALAISSNTAILGKSIEGVELSRRDIGRLLPPGDMVPGREPWLNDEVINAWYANLCARLNERDGYVKGPNAVPRWVAYGTQWYKSASERGVDSIKTWSRRKGIKNDKLLQTHRIFFPINEHSHWTLLTISGREKTIQYLDSMSDTGWLKTRYTDIAKQWLAMELGGSYKPDEWRVLHTKTSQQCNANDCGVFTCLNGLALSAGSQDPSADFDEHDIPDARAMFIAMLLNGGFKGSLDLDTFFGFE